MKPLAVLAVASEAYPLVKTGGLGDVTGALPAALADEGIAVRTLLPGYAVVLDAVGSAPVVHAVPDLHGGTARVRAARVHGLDFLVLDAPHLFARTGNPYVGPDGHDWPDNAVRFAALSSMAADIGRGAIAGYTPDVVHAHDWQAGLAPAYLHYGGHPRPQTVMSLHNLAFQGQFPKELLGTLGLPPHAWSINGVEYFDTIGYLKAGIALADRVTTVSPRYAVEIRTPEFGMGLDGLLRERAGVVSGILNGIDTGVWNPATDSRLAARYDAAHPEKRGASKIALRGRLHLAQDAGAPLFGVVSRLTWQKGMDLLVEAIPAAVALGAQVAILGSGERDLESALRTAAREHPERVATVVGFDEDLAHLFQAGCDAILMPSRFEPCGLTQLCALRYGAIPIVSEVGGLVDTVTDIGERGNEGTGLCFSPVTLEAFVQALRRGVALWKDPQRWQAAQRRAMGVEVGWRASARRYASLYRELAAPMAA